MRSFLCLLLCLAFGLIEALIGGTRLLFGLPTYAIIGVAALLSALAWRRSAGRYGPDNLCLIATFCLFGYLIGRNLLSPVAYLAWLDLFSLLGSLTVYLLVAYVLTGSTQRLALLMFLVAVGIVHLVAGAMQFSRGDNFMLISYFGRSTEYNGRASGLYICPNHLAGYLEVVGILALSAGLWARCRGWVKLLYGYLALTCLAGLLLTGSRGGFLSAGTGITVLAGFSLLRARSMFPQLYPRLALGTVILAALALTGVGVTVRHSGVLKARAARMFNTNDVRITTLWPAGIKQFNVHPVVGTGSGTHLYYGRLFRDPNLKREPVHVHNDYIELLAEYGIVGALGLGVFLTAHLRWGLRTYRQYLKQHASQGMSAMSTSVAFNLGAMSAAAAMIVHSALDFNLHIPANALLMAAVFGMIANPGRAAANLNALGSERENSGMTGRLALAALGIWLLASGLPKLPGEFFCEEARKALRDNRPPEALACALRGVHYEKSNPTLYFYLGQARFDVGLKASNPVIRTSFFRDATKDYKQGLELFPQDINLLLYAGKAYSYLGQYDEAEAVFQQAWRWDPNGYTTKIFYDAYLRAVAAKQALPSPEPAAPKSLAKPSVDE